MLRILKWLGIGVLGLLGIGVIAGLILHEEKPKSNPSAEADELARQMLTAIDYEAWDSIKVVRWDFANRHQYV